MSPSQKPGHEYESLPLYNENATEVAGGSIELANLEASTNSRPTSHRNARAPASKWTRERIQAKLRVAAITIGYVTASIVGICGCIIALSIAFLLVWVTLKWVYTTITG